MPPPGLNHELELRASHQYIAGVDEAGRGCLAGPVVASAVILGPHVLAAPELLQGVTDSKKLKDARLTALYDRITSTVHGWAIGVVDAATIDALGIVPATRQAMLAAIASLPYAPDALLVDAVPLRREGAIVRSFPHGELASLSIAAASIIAKVSRDRLMDEADRAWPAYGFAAHKGYPTSEHMAALERHGISPLHRVSFRPVAQVRMLHGL